MTKQKKLKDKTPWKSTFLGMIARDDKETARENGYDISVHRQWNPEAKKFTDKYEWSVFQPAISKRHWGVVATRRIAMREARRFARTLPIPTKPRRVKSVKR